MRILFILVFFLFFASAGAYAMDMAAWVVDKEKSTLTFAGSQGGKEFKGRFAQFTPDIEFSADRLSQSHFKVVIDMASAQTGDKTYDGSLPGSEWFNVAKFPQAIFESTSITGGVSDKLGVTSYTAQGKLTLLGVTRDITLPFSLKAEDSLTHAFGEIVLKRLDFGIGEKTDSKAEWVDNDVHVRFDVYAHP